MTRHSDAGPLLDDSVTATGKESGYVRALRAETPSVFRSAGWAAAARGAFPFVVILIVWWAVWAIVRPSNLILVPPSQVVSSLLELIREGVLPAYIAHSLGRLAIGIVISLVVGIPLGWLLGLDRHIAAAVEPMLRFFNAVSGIAWLPLLILWFGFSDRTVTAVIVYTMIFPVVFNTMIGVGTIPTRLSDAARTLGAGPLRIIRDVYMPGSFPSVMMGVRLGIGFGWRALIAGEFVVGNGGLGFLIFNARTQGVIRDVMAGMIVLGLLWLLIDRLILRPFEELVGRKWGIVE